MKRDRGGRTDESAKRKQRASTRRSLQRMRLVISQRNDPGGERGRTVYFEKLKFESMPACSLNALRLEGFLARRSESKNCLLAGSNEFRAGGAFIKLAEIRSKYDSPLGPGRSEAANWKSATGSTEICESKRSRDARTPRFRRHAPF